MDRPEEIDFAHFLGVDMRVGRIVDVDDFPEARNPAWKLLIDFGPEIGQKRSSAQITNYSREELDTLVVAVVNFPPRQIGPVRSEVLVWAPLTTTSGWCCCAPTAMRPRGPDRLSVGAGAGGAKRQGKGGEGRGKGTEQGGAGRGRGRVGKGTERAGSGHGAVWFRDAGRANLPRWMFRLESGLSQTPEPRRNGHVTSPPGSSGL